ncbi:signal transduction histidine kinase/Tfp pilus assembly protein PilF [Pedobacter cryoconitis]|uniref:histidine kinase n=1 Tax=Pedobacter cryoconitis TaxID=188932 RepID=A0A7W8YTS5_9SPHI|nr:tetratricopeptide repeat-containing sensor histidine kinase [Pedobacter cryoconitis]MBB5621375.1 signal transduction histidine kinase/Tfp pilus assembly protein PilF [Pedobacter cryoconitis]
MFFQSTRRTQGICKSLILLLCLAYTLIAVSCNPVPEPPQNHKAHFDTVINQASTFIGNGQPKQAAVYLDSAYHSFANPGVKDTYRKYENLINIYLHYDFDTDKARLYTDSIFHILKGRETLYKEEYANGLFFLGEVFMAEKRYTEAFKSYYDGRSFALKNLEDCSLSIFSNKMGLVRFSQEQYHKAIPYFKEAIEENKDCKPNMGFDYLFISPQAYMNTIAMCFERSGHPDSAIFYYQKALTFIAEKKGHFPKRETFISSASGVIYGNLGGIYSKNNNYDQAEKYLTQSIAINDHPGYDIQDAQTAKLKLAELYIRHSDFEKADRLLNELQVYLSSKAGTNQLNFDTRLNWFRLRYEYHDKRKEPLTAYPYLKKYHKGRDSIYKIDKHQKNIDIDQAFKDTAQKYRMTLLNKDNQLKTAYLSAAIICMLMVMIILFFIWHNLKRSRKLNKQISEQNINMQQTLDSLEQSQEENVRVMMIVAHDLRNPIGNITSIANLMLTEQGRSEDDLEMLGMIKTSGQNSLFLVNDLLKSNSKIENLQKEPVDLYVLLNYCVNLLRHKAKEKNQQLVLHAEQVTIPLNMEKMWRVMSNLIGNAIKFSPESATITVRMKEKQDSVLIAVADHGIGVPTAIQDKIFDMFGQAKRSGTAGEQPFGLGLAISKQIIETHGGKIWVESEAGKGSIFYVELPLY